MKRQIKDPHVFAVCMGMDAMRISLGLPPKNFAASEVARWVNLLAGSVVSQARGDK